MQNGWWGRLILRDTLAETGPYPFKNADFQSISARSASAEHLAKKVLINTNRKSIMRFPMA